MKVSTGRLLGQLGTYAAAAGVLVFFGAPLMWMVSTAFKSQAEWFSIPPNFLPSSPTLANFVKLSETDFPRFFLNSLIASTLTTVFSFAIALYAAYAVSSLRFAGQRIVILIILLTQLVPTAVIVLPLYQLAAEAGALDSLIGLSLAYVSFTAPVAVWLLSGFFRQLPMELIEAAMIDNCTRGQAFRKVILPVALPGLVATAMYSFFTAWQELLLALTFISSKEKSTFTVGILGFIGEHTTDWGGLMAAALLLTVPVFLIFWRLQKYLVAGLTSGAVKG
ncbi:MAG: carbohydrate ABC transporter permease [Nostocoides sp.]